MAILAGCGCIVPQAPFQLAAGRRQQVVIAQGGMRGNGVDLGESGRWSLQHRDRDRPIERNDGRIVEDHELIIEADDIDSVRFIETRSGGVAGGNTRFQVIARQMIPVRGGFEIAQAPLNPFDVPRRSILIRQQQQVAIAVDA